MESLGIRRQDIPHDVPFPLRLHIMLHEMEMSSRTHIVSWMPSGRSFRVHNREAFARDILPGYFRSRNFRSFQRNLSVYRFVRIRSGPEAGAYCHEDFVRNDRERCRNMQRHVAPPSDKKGKETSSDLNVKKERSKKRPAPASGIDEGKKPPSNLSMEETGPSISPIAAQPRVPFSSGIGHSQNELQALMMARGLQQGAPQGVAAREHQLLLGQRREGSLQAFGHNFAMMPSLQSQAASSAGLLPAASSSSTDDEDPFLLDRLWSQTLATSNPSLLPAMLPTGAPPANQFFPIDNQGYNTIPREPQDRSSLLERLQTQRQQLLLQQQQTLMQLQQQEEDPPDNDERKFS